MFTLCTCSYVLCGNKLKFTTKALICNAPFVNLGFLGGVGTQHCPYFSLNSSKFHSRVENPAWGPSEWGISDNALMQIFSAQFIFKMVLTDYITVNSLSFHFHKILCYWHRNTHLPKQPKLIWWPLPYYSASHWQHHFLAPN